MPSSSASSLSPVCSASTLQREPELSLALLAQFQQEGGDDEWRALVNAEDCALVHALASHLAAALPPASQSSSSALAHVSDLALYSALVNLLFVFASLTPDTVCPVLLAHDVLNIPIIIAGNEQDAAERLSSLLLLRLQLLALTISSYPPSIHMPSPHPLILHQTLTLLAVEDADIHLAASACIFLLLSISSVPLSLPVLLSHPALPTLLSACLALLVPGSDSPFLPLALTVLDNLASWMGVKEGRGEDKRLSGEDVLAIWDAVCELLEGEGASGDALHSAIRVLSSLLSLPSLQSPVTLQQYAHYKRKFQAQLASSDEEQQQQQQQQQHDLPDATPAVQPNASAPSPAASSPGGSLNPFDDLAPPQGSLLHQRVPFCEDDCRSILASSSPSLVLSPAELLSKVEALADQVDHGEADDWWALYLQQSQYQLLLVLALVYTQRCLPAPSDRLVLSVLLRLSSLSPEAAAVAAAALSHPSFLDVLLSQLSPDAPAPQLVLRLRILYLVYTSQSSAINESDDDAASSCALFTRLLPLLTHEDSDGCVVVLAIYLILLSHCPSTPISAGLLSHTSSYAFQSELLHILNRGALPLLSSLTLADSDRSRQPPLTSASLLFLCDLLADPRGPEFLYSTDLYVLVDLLLQRIEDEDQVAEDERKDVVLLCERVLSLLVQWEGWRTKDGGYKRKQLAELMQQLQAGEEHGAGGAQSRAVVRRRKQLAAELLQRVLPH